MALVFTGDEFADDAEVIARTLKQHSAQASFFFTGRFYRNAHFKSAIQRLKQDGHYLGAHSDEHVLYCDWNQRDKVLISHEAFERDLKKNYAVMRAFDRVPKVKLISCKFNAVVQSLIVWLYHS